jgi:hypothetical protein
MKRSRSFVKPELPMKNNRLSTNDQISNAMGIEGGPDHLFNRVHPFPHGAALPVPVFVGLHFVEAVVLADCQIHAVERRSCS